MGRATEKARLHAQAGPVRKRRQTLCGQNATTEGIFDNGQLSREVPSSVCGGIATGKSHEPGRLRDTVPKLMEHTFGAVVCQQMFEEIAMRTLAAVTLASAIALAFVSPAQARQGCGAGFHRGPYGHCRPNVRAQVYVVGRYYPHRGYWDGRRWHANRYRDHDHWRYR